MQINTAVSGMYRPRIARVAVLWALPLALFFAPPPSFADQDLLDSIPSDTVMVAQSMGSSEDDFLQAYYSEVFAAFEETKIVDEVVSLFRSKMSKDELAEFDKVWEQLVALYNAFDLKAMAEADSVFAMRWETKNVTFQAEGKTIPRTWPGLIFIFRLDQAAADKNYKAFQGVQEAIKNLEPTKMTVTEADKSGAKLSTLDIAGAIRVDIAKRDNVLVLGLFNGAFIDDVLALMNGEDGYKSIKTEARFTEAIGMLPPPDTALIYVDQATMMSRISAAMNHIYTLPDAQADPEMPKIKQFLDRLFAELAMFDRTASTVRFEGFQQITEEVIITTDATRKTIIGSLIAAPGSIEDWASFVPKETKSFSLMSGVDLLGFYEAVVRVVTTEVPETKQFIDMGEAQFKTFTTLDLRTDVLGWLDGKFFFLDLSTQGGASTMPKFVMMVGTKDRDKSMTMIATIIKKVNDLLKSNKQMGIMTNQAAGDLGKKGYVTLMHPMLVMAMINPVVGVEQDFVVVGTSTDVITKMLATRAGESPNILENESYKKEGLMPEGEIRSISFSDLRGAAEAAASSLGMVGMMQGFIPQDDEDADVVRAMFSIISRLGPVVQKMNFTKSTASMSKFDGNNIRKVSYTNYAAPDER